MKEHDTIATIAVLKNISPELLATHNKLSVTAALKPGQVIKIPKSGAATKDKASGTEAKISDAADVANVAASTVGYRNKNLIESYQNIQKAKGEKDIVVSDLREKLLTESTSFSS